MPKTYEPIATTTFASAAASYTFSSIPQTYTDLILVLSGTTASDELFFAVRFNGDSSAIYSNTYMGGNGSVTFSGRATGDTRAYLTGSSDTTSPTMGIGHIQDYTNTNVYKTLMSRTDDPSLVTELHMNLWRSTAAITSLVISSGSNINVGTTITLYGIKAA